MSAYVHTLTDIELACGVTLEQVAAELPRVLIRDSGATVIVDATNPPALCASVARCAFGDRPHKLESVNAALGLAIYVFDASTGQ